MTGERRKAEGKTAFIDGAAETEHTLAGSVSATLGLFIVSFDRNRLSLAPYAAMWNGRAAAQQYVQQVMNGKE